MFTPDQDGVYARVQASAPRRVVAVTILVLLGALVIYAALAQPPALQWLVFMLLFGGGVLWVAEKLRRATAVVIELTGDELRDSSGRVLAKISNVQQVERGAFAMKPSQGFTLVLRQKMPRAWAPGMWWRFGKRLGVGGVTSSGQAKFMAEQIALQIAKQTA